MEKLLPVYDNLQRALKQETADAAFKKGVEMTMTELVKILNGLGVEIFGEEGEEFDPKIHKIVSKIEVEEEEKHATIAEVVNSGYKWRGMVLQKMEVVVYRFG